MKYKVKVKFSVTEYIIKEAANIEQAQSLAVEQVYEDSWPIDIDIDYVEGRAHLEEVHTINSDPSESI